MAKTIIPIGPYHPLQEEPEFFRLHVEGEKVVGLDIGSGSVSLVVSDPDNVDLIVRSDLGLGAPMKNVLKNIGLTDIFGWTDGHTRANEVRDFIFNKSLMVLTHKSISSSNVPFQSQITWE